VAGSVGAGHGEAKGGSAAQGGGHPAGRLKGPPRLPGAAVAIAGGSHSRGQPQPEAMSLAQGTGRLNAWK